MEESRKLVTIRAVTNISPINGADNIEVATVDGWRCVVKKGEFSVGDLAVYFEIDSLLPMIPPFEFLRNKGTKKMMVDGVEKEGYRLRTIKLRGQISQGLIMPLHILPCTNCEPPAQYTLGEDVTQIMGVIKYEPPIPAQLAGKIKGNFPVFIKRTDQERCQNLVEQIGTAKGMKFEVTEKMDGTSMTVYLYNGVFGVCSRNLDLMDTEGNTHWGVAKANDLENKLRALGRNIALQGELCGVGIQKNSYKLTGQQFYLFDIYDIEGSHFLPPKERLDIAAKFDLHVVPIVSLEWTLDCDVRELLIMAEGMSAFGTMPREGIVLKSSEKYGSDIFSFKAISNAYLLENE